MSDLRNRATPATYRLSDSLAELERTDPAVRKAAANLDRVTAEIIARGEARLAELEAAERAKPPLSAYLRERHEALTCALTQPCVVRWEAPAELVNRGNGSQGVSVKGMHARAASRKAQRELGSRIARQFYGSVLVIPGLARSHAAFFVVVLTRIAPRGLDGPNLDHTFKSVIDGIATGLGIDDRSSLVRYVTSQEQGAPRQHAIRAELFIQPKSEAP